MASSSGMARLALACVLGSVALGGCSVVVGAVLDGKDSDGGAPVACMSDPECDDANPCTEDRCPDGRCVRTVVAEGIPCNADGMCRAGVCMPCPPGGCGLRCPMVPCMGVEMCIEGMCVPPPCSDVIACPMGAMCVANRCEPCVGGVCPPSSCTDASSCDDFDDCTTDTCDPETGCKHTALDADGDGVGWITCGGTDCDDSNAAIHPGATEICNDADDDCNGAVDDVGITTVWYPDMDMDGFGDSGAAPMTSFGCSLPTGAADNNLDCYDSNPAAHPYDPSMGGIPFFPAQRGDGSFDYDCDGTERKELGPPACSDGGSSACGAGETSCTGAPGILTSPTVCGMMYPLSVCASCRTPTAPCGRASGGSMITLKCN